MNGRKVVHAPGSDELFAGAKDLTALGIRGNQVEGSDILWVYAKLLADDPHHRRLRSTYGEHRLHVALAIRLELILAVEVDRQGRQAQQGAGIDQVAAAILRDDLAADGELAVEPAVEKHPAIDLDGYLLPPCGIEIRGGLESQAGRIGVRADNAEAGIRAGASGDIPCHDRSAAHHDMTAWCS